MHTPASLSTHFPVFCNELVLLNFNVQLFPYNAYISKATNFFKKWSYLSFHVERPGTLAMGMGLFFPPFPV